MAIIIYAVFDYQILQEPSDFLVLIYMRDAIDEININKYYLLLSGFSFKCQLLSFYA